MAKLKFHMGATLRCYGNVEIEAESIEAALPLLTADFIGSNIEITETTTDSGQDLAIIDVSDAETGEELADYGGHPLSSPYDPQPDAGLIATLKRTLNFLEEEAENRASAGSEYSDYEREPRTLADEISAAIAKAEGRIDG